MDCNKRMRLSLRTQNLHNGSLIGPNFEVNAAIRTNDETKAEGIESNTETQRESFPIATLCNVGNTCYLNSVLYGLRWIGANFINKLHSIACQLEEQEKVDGAGHLKGDPIHHQEKSKRNEITVCLAIHQLFQEMHKVERDTDAAETSKVVTPSRLLAAIRKVNESYEGSDQHDAHELLATFVDSIEIAFQLTRRRKISNRMTNIKRCRNAKGMAEAELFHGKTVIRTKCLECENTVQTEDVFWDVPFSLTATVQSKDSISSETRTADCLTGENKFWCQRCLHYTEAYRSTHFVQMPKVLVIRTEQSVMASPITATNDLHKANEKLNVPVELPCLLESCSKLCSSVHHIYHLKSVICHTGATFSSGHYTTYIRRESLQRHGEEITPRCKTRRRNELVGNEVKSCCTVSVPNGLDSKCDSWLHFDDEKVSSFDSLPIFGTEYSTVVPYLLFYSNSD